MDIYYEFTLRVDSNWWIKLQSLKKQKIMTKLISKNRFPTSWNTRDEFVTPFSSMFDRLFEQHFPEFKEDYGINFGKGSYPKVDVIDRNDSVSIIAEIAGWDSKDIEIAVEKGILSITGNISSEKKQDESNGRYIVRELKRSSFTRSFHLGDKLDENTITAEFDNGILHIKIAKRVLETEPAKKIINIK